MQSLSTYGRSSIATLGWQLSAVNSSRSVECFAEQVTVVDIDTGTTNFAKERGR